MLNKAVRACVFAWILCATTWHSFVTSSTTFNVYWNVPSEQCLKHNVTIEVGKFGILQNDGDLFHGEKINILYRPGAFPYIDDDGKYINGGIPQNANLATHVQQFINDLDEFVPHNFMGAAIIDFEKYYPSYSSSGKEYQEASREWVRERYPHLNPEEVEMYAEESFNTSSNDLFLSLLWVGRELRPGGSWGYYHFPYCNNYAAGEEECKEKIMEMNDNLSWMYEASAAIYPSLYLRYDGFSPQAQRQYVRGPLTEALRVRQRYSPAVPILPYFWFRYRDLINDYLSPVDMVNTLGQIFMMGIDGGVLWGGSADVSTKEQCLKLKAYAEEQLGPLVEYLLQLLRPELRHAINPSAALKRLTRTVIRRALRKGRGRRTEAKPSNTPSKSKVWCGNSIWDRCEDD